MCCLYYTLIQYQHVKYSTYSKLKSNMLLIQYTSILYTLLQCIVSHFVLLTDKVCEYFENTIKISCSVLRQIVMHNSLQKIVSLKNCPVPAHHRYFGEFLVKIVKMLLYNRFDIKKKKKNILAYFDLVPMDI